MSRIAKWRRGPGDPVTARGWLFRSEPRESERIDPRRAALYTGVFVAYLLVGMAFVRWFPHSQWVGPLLVVMAPLARIPFDRKPKSAPPPAVGAEEGFDVLLSVRDAQDRTTGQDRGLLIFCDGWLLFEGRRTEFAVTRGEADGRTEPRMLRLWLDDGRTIVFTAPEMTDAQPMKRAYDVWHRTVPPDGEAVLPPLETHPEVRVGRWTLCLLGAAALAVPAALGAAFGFWLVSVPTALTIVACLVIAGLYARRLREELPKVFPTSSSPHPSAYEASGASPR